MSAIDLLKAAGEAVGLWPSHLPGHVNFGAEAFDVDGELEDGAHRLATSPWQFIVEGGRIVAAVRDDLSAWRVQPETVHAEDLQPKEKTP
jgi:hypothetical protein